MQQDMMKQPIPQQQMSQGGAMPMQPPPQQQQNIPQIRAEDLQKVLLQRVAQLSPEETDVLDAMITPETVMVLVKLFPELGVVFIEASALRGADEKEEMGTSEEDVDSKYGSDIVPAQGVSKGLVR